MTSSGSNIVPIDIPAALNELGIEYVISGEEAKALCPDPDHDDTTPSWFISLDSGMHHCFSCGFGGSFLYLVTVTSDMSFDGARQWTQRRKVRDIADGKQRQSHKKKYAEITAADLWEFRGDYPEEELEFRGFNADEAHRFNLLWDQNRDGWIIPVCSADDRLVGYQFKPRHGTDGVPLFYPKHLKKTGRIFDNLGVIEGDLLIIVESPLDVVCLYAMGYENVVALFGASMDAEQAERIIGNFSKVILFLDDDEPGRHGVRKALTLLKGVEVHVFAYGDTQRMGTYYVHGEVTGEDPGTLSKGEVAEGITRATPGFRTGFM